MDEPADLEPDTRLDDEMATADGLMALIVVLTIAGALLIAGVAAILGAF